MDIQLYSEEKGAGKPIILLHGNGESSAYFENQIPFLSKKFRVIAIDTRGHGRSPRGTAPFTICQFAEDLNAFLIDHSIEKADLLGFSDGGNIALTFALSYPEKVDRLILNGANLDPSGVKRRFQIPIEIIYRIFSRFPKKDEKTKRSEEMLGLMVNDPHIDPDALAKVTMKTLVIVGTSDMIRDSHSVMIAEKIPNAQLIRIQGDHFIAKKNPKLFNAAIGAFLR